MDRNEGNEIGKKLTSSVSRPLNERLVKERTKALELLQGKSEKATKENPELIKPSKTLLGPSETSNVPGSCCRISPVNREKDFKNSKPSTSHLLVPKRSDCRLKSPGKGLPSKQNECLQTIANVSAASSFQKNTTSRNYLSTKNLSPCSVQSNSPSKSECSDYVPFRRREVIDLSDLITDTSINLEDCSSLCQTSSSKSNDKVSFNPAEMTGRSTLHKGDSKLQKPTPYSVDEILASSFVENVRGLRSSTVGTGRCHTGIDRISTASSCISGFSAMQKNPRPTTVFENLSNAPDLSIQLLGNGTHKESTLSFKANKTKDCIYDMEDFAPGEMMHSKLLEDEISWAQKHALVPTAVLSKEAHEKLTTSQNRNGTGNTTNVSNILNSLSLNDTNFSVGGFFAMRSDNISNIIRKDNADRAREPIALLSDDTVTTTTTSPEKTLDGNEQMTPVIDNQIYSQVVEKEGSTLTRTITKQTYTENHDSKDSGNATGKSDLLSLSAIDEALGNLKHAASGSAAARMVNELLSKAGKPGRTNNADGIVSSYVPGESLENERRNTIDLVKRAEQLNAIAEVILENKENIQLTDKGANNMSETLSFTESLLNTSIQNYRTSSAGQARSPLSPIPIHITEPDNVDNDADIDEFNNSPIISPGRRRRFWKSPQNSREDICIAREDVETNKKNTPDSSGKIEENSSISGIKIVSSPKEPVALVGKKSLCSTRVDGDQSSPAGSSVDILSNFSKSSRALTPTHANNSTTLNTFELSPLSSPCSNLSSAINSPVNSNKSIGQHSLNNNRIGKATCTTPGGLRRVASSPGHSEVGGKGNTTNTFCCGAKPMRTYSSNSIKSGDSTSTRSTSRCSNNSEFSHRDGKRLPIKATALELSWPSVKLRTDSHKSMQVKNTSKKRLMVRIEICGPGFQLINPDSNMLTLQSQECRTIVINFYPTVIGPAIGRLVFQPPRSLNKSNNSNNTENASANSEVNIPLYAYGGNASIIIQHLLRGPVGAPFLPMGEFCTLIRPLERSFQIFNKGPLMGFAAIYIEPIGLHVPEISNSFRVSPECTLIEPSTAVTIRLVFEPNQNDLRKIRKIIHDVLTLAKLRIIYGDEAIRQRLRQIQRFMTSAARENVFTRTLDKLWVRFPGEQVMFSPGIFKDSASVAQDMWACISEQEVSLTLNNNMLDETAAEMSTIFTEADNTILFRTVLVSPSDQLERVDELLEESHTMIHESCIGIDSSEDDEEGAVSSTSTRSGIQVAAARAPSAISPECIKIDFNNPQELSAKPIILRVRNFVNTKQYFKIVCNHRNLLRFVPNDGYVQPNGIEFPIEVYKHPTAEIQETPQDLTITVYMENKKITVPVYAPSNSSMLKH